MDASSLMGPLLLKGWAMGAEACDLDSIPIMLDKRLKGGICCGCQPKLGEYIVNGCKIVADGPLYLLQNDSKSIKFRVKKENGLFSLQGKVEDEVPAPKPKAAPVVEEKKVAEPVQPKAQAAAPVQVVQAVQQPRQELNESQKLVLQSLQTKQKNLALALDSVNDLDAIKNLVDIIAGIQTAINLITK